MHQTVALLVSVVFLPRRRQRQVKMRRSWISCPNTSEEQLLRLCSRAANDEERGRPRGYREAATEPSSGFNE